MDSDELPPKLESGLAPHRAHVIWLSLSRPFILLTRSFICFILSLYTALMYGIYYLMFTTFPGLFGDVYHFGVGTTGLAYTGLGVGFAFATAFLAHYGDSIYAQFVNRNGGVQSPELRMPILLFGSLFVPSGLFWYGWSAQAQVHWIMPIIGTGLFGFGFAICFQSTQLYLLDSFKFGASAISAAAVFRSLLGFAFPLFGSQMYAALGNGGGNSLLGGLSVVIGIPFPVWIWYYGDRIRARSKIDL